MGEVQLTWLGCNATSQVRQEYSFCVFKKVNSLEDKMN